MSYRAQKDHEIYQSEEYQKRIERERHSLSAMNNWEVVNPAAESIAFWQSRWAQLNEMLFGLKHIPYNDRECIFESSFELGMSHLFGYIQNDILKPDEKTLEDFQDDVWEYIEMFGSAMREIFAVLVTQALHAEKITLQDAARITGLSVPELAIFKAKAPKSWTVVEQDVPVPPPYSACADDEIPF